MALLVAQTRIEAGVHSVLEVAVGGAARRARYARDLPGVLRMTDDELLARAPTRSRSAPTRRTRSFHVGCAVAHARRAVVEGVNVENAAYPLGVCAERTAFSRAMAEGYDGFVTGRGRLSAASHGGGSRAIAVTDGCRQWLARDAGRAASASSTCRPRRTDEVATCDVASSTVSVPEHRLRGRQAGASDAV